MARQTKKEIMENVDHVKAHIVANNTIEYHTANGARVIRLHNTDIVIFRPNGDIVLKAEGWQTVTTKERMNRYLPHGFNLYQQNSIWYLRDTLNSKEYIYQDGITIHPDLTVSDEGEDPKAALKLKKSIQAYVKKYVKALFAGKVPKPDNGDCLYCLMTDVKTGKPIKETSHLLSHIDEDYFVPSLLANAINEIPISTAALHVLSTIWSGEGHKANGLTQISKDQLSKSLKRYLYRQLGFAA